MAILLILPNMAMAEWRLRGKGRSLALAKELHTVKAFTCKHKVTKTTL